MKKHIVYLLSIACLALSACKSQRPTTLNQSQNSSTLTAHDTLVIMSYNVENFFDPEDDPTRFDDDFTPEGVYHWTLPRMMNKARRLARVITSAGGRVRPDIVGLCEVEGLQATNVLANETGLSNKYVAYKSIAYPTPDGRGIGVAILYDAQRVELIGSYPIFVSKPDSGLHTRDVLYAKFRLRTTSDTVHVMMNHWPSKYSGAKESVWKRNHVAARVRHSCDSLLSINRNAQIVLLGDFNDTADCEAITDILGARTLTNVGHLLNLSADTQDFSYRYKGRWQTIDHIIVSQGTCHVSRPKFSVFRAPYLLEDDDLYPGQKPKRTYIGRRYNYSVDNLGGYSDHLPVLVKIPM